MSVNGIRKMKKRNVPVESKSGLALQPPGTTQTQTLLYEQLPLPLPTGGPYVLAILVTAEPIASGYMVTARHTIYMPSPTTPQDLT